MRRILLFILVLFTFLLPAYSVDDEQESDELKSLTQERREILLYGIDSQIIGVLESLKTEKNPSLAAEAEDIFTTTLNSKVKLAVLSYFEEIKYTEAADQVLAYLKRYDDDMHSADIIAASVRYLSGSSKKVQTQSLDLFIELSRHEDGNVARAAVEAIGGGEDDRSVDFLIKLYEDDEADINLKSVILSSLGRLKAHTALSMLEDILEDPDQEKSLRWRACQAIGEIGEEGSLPVLRRALSSDDTYLRSYATAALQSFEGKEVEELLIEALKDSFWRVRISAAETLGKRKSESSVSILIFKAQKDPEANVRLAAFKALGSIGSSEAIEFVTSILEKKSASLPLRQEAVAILLQHDADGSIGLFEKIFADLWEEKNSPLLDTLGKNLSMTEQKDLQPLFEKMLGHPEIPMKIYAIRGIGRNGFTALKGRLEELSAAGNPASVRREALAVLENM